MKYTVLIAGGFKPPHKGHYDYIKFYLDNPDVKQVRLYAGYKTRVAANYNQALIEIDKKLPDVAIIDVKLDKGDNDGIELLSHIKKKE